MTKKLAVGLLFVLIAVTIGLFVVSKSKNPDVAVETPSDSESSLDERLEQDSQVIAEYNESKATDQRFELYEAVLRLARQGDKSALPVALDFAKSDDQLLREGAAQALGYFDDDAAFEALLGLTNDSEESVRRMAFQGFSRSSSPKRIEAMKKLIAGDSTNDINKIDLLGAVFLISDDKDMRDNSIKSLMEFTRSDDEYVADSATLKLVQLQPASQQTFELLKKAILDTNNTQIFGVAIKTLSLKKDPWLEENLTRLIKHENPFIRRVTVQSFRRSCTNKRHDLLTEVLSTDPDDSVKETAIRELTAIGGARSLGILESLEDASLGQKAKALKEDGLRKIKNGDVSPPCGDS